MTSIMQGTTPSVTISIPSADLPLSSVTEIELYCKNADRMTVYKKKDLTVNTSANTITKVFSAAETAALRPGSPLVIQGRFWIGNSAVGINKITIGVSDMLGVGSDA